MRARTARSSSQTDRAGVAEFADAELADAEFADAELADAQLEDAQLEDAQLEDAEFAPPGPTEGGGSALQPTKPVKLITASPVARMVGVIGCPRVRENHSRRPPDRPGRGITRKPRSFHLPSIDPLKRAAGIDCTERAWAMWTKDGAKTCGDQSKPKGDQEGRPKGLDIRATLIGASKRIALSRLENRLLG